MQVLIDSPVWSLILRRNNPDAAAQELVKRLSAAGQARTIGPVVQEVLSGMRTAPKFVQVRDSLRLISLFTIVRDDYETAGEYFSLCRTRGVAASQIDMLIAAVAVRERAKIYTFDRDFEYYREVIPIELFTVADSSGLA